MSEATHRPSNPRQGALPWWRPTVLGGVLLGGMIVGAGGFALAQGAPGPFGWHHGPHLERIQQHILHALDGVGATTAQETKIHDIVAAAFADMDHDQADMGTMRQQVAALLRAPTIDRAAVEKLRAEQVARFDAKSKAVVGAVLDSAEQLTPDQRMKLVERAEAMMQHGPMGGRWERGRDGGWMDGHRPHPMDGDQGPDNGPGRGPDDGPDKG